MLIQSSKQQSNKVPKQACETNLQAQHNNFIKACHIRVNGLSVSCYAFLHPLTSQSAESHTAAHKIIKRNSALVAVALYDRIHSLRAQIVTCMNKEDIIIQQWCLYLMAKGKYFKQLYPHFKFLFFLPIDPMACCISWPSTAPLWSRSKDAKVAFQPFRAWHRSLNSLKPKLPDMSLWESTLCQGTLTHLFVFFILFYEKIKHI